MICCRFQILIHAVNLSKSKWLLRKIMPLQLLDKHPFLFTVTACKQKKTILLNLVEIFGTKFQIQFNKQNVFKKNIKQIFLEKKYPNREYFSHKQTQVNWFTVFLNSPTLKSYFLFLCQCYRGLNNKLYFFLKKKIFL